MMDDMESWDDPEKLGNNEKFQEMLINFEVQNGHSARVFIESYLTAMVFMNSVKKDFVADSEHFNEIFDNDPRVVRFMAAAAILISNTVATISVGTLTTARGSVFLASVFKMGLILGMLTEHGPLEEEKLADAFDGWFDEFDFSGPMIEDDETED